MTGRTWPRRDWDPEEASNLFRECGFGTDADVERATRLRKGRLDELAENGWSPHVFELKRMADVLDMSMDELFDATFMEQG